MKKVININFQGTIIPIEESSYELLKQYIESLRRYFSQEEGSNEIVNDIESRISELFNARLKAGSTCITDEDVQDIIKSIGRPEDLEENELSGDAEGPSTEQKEKKEEDFSFNFNNYRSKSLYRDENNKVLGGVCSGIAAYFNIDPVIVRVLFVLFGITGVGFLLYLILWIFVPGSIGLQNGVRKRMYRNPDEKIFGGVCSGFGTYFNLNPWIFRIFFLLPLFSLVNHSWYFGIFRIFNFSPGFIIVYIILWLVIPEAHTTSEKLEMKGEKVDLNSIKNSVLQEMKDVGERVGKMGAEAGSVAAEKGAQIGKDIHQASMKTGGKLGDVIVTLLKIFLYFILGCIALAIILSLLGLAVVAIGIFPLKDFVLNDGWQTVYAWGTLIFFVAVPVIGIITFIIRRFARVKSQNNSMGWSFSGLWVIGWVFMILLVSSVARDFKGISSMNEETVALNNPEVNSMLVKPIQTEKYRRNSWFRLEPFSTYGIADDTALIGNVNVRIKKSPTAGYKITVIKIANGNSRRDADTLAALIPFSLVQQDSVILMDKGITINTTDKFRNQQVEVTIYVPVGHKIKIDKSFGYRNRVSINSNFRNRDWYDYQENKGFSFNYGIEYIMKENGLFTLKGKAPSSFKDNEDQNDWNNEEDQNNYRYNGNNFDSLKTEQQNQLDKMERALDSTKDAQRKEMDRLKDSLRKAKDEIDKRIEKLNTASFSCTEDRDGVIIRENPFIMNI